MYLESIEGKWTCHSVLTRCDECGSEYKALIRTADRQMKEIGLHQCKKCSSRRAGKKTAAKMSKVYSERWLGEKNPAKQDDIRKKISASKKGIKFTEEHKQALRKPKSKTGKIKEAANRPDEVERRRERMINNNPTFKIEVRNKISQAISQLYVDGVYENHPFGTGSYVSTDKTLKPIWCRSKLEQDFVNNVSKYNNLLSIESAERLRIPYEFEGCTKNYLPDFRLTFNYGYVLLVEMKSTYFYAMAQWKAKEKALDSFCKSVGLDYLVLTEKDMDKWLEQLNE